jgi:hypothetical protein
MPIAVPLASADAILLTNEGSDASITLNAVKNATRAPTTNHRFVAIQHQYELARSEQKYGRQKYLFHAPPSPRRR